MRKSASFSATLQATIDKMNRKHGVYQLRPGAQCHSCYQFIRWEGDMPHSCEGNAGGAHQFNVFDLCKINHGRNPQ